jgi:hypothetical protein
MKPSLLGVRGEIGMVSTDSIDENPKAGSTGVLRTGLIGSTPWVAIEDMTKVGGVGTTSRTGFTFSEVMPEKARDGAGSDTG